jgi:WhiB family redox-sensing transcriptional regulator
MFEDDLFAEEVKTRDNLSSDELDIDIMHELALVACAPSDWHKSALCLGVGPDLFFDRENLEEAKKICEYCPVKPQCLEAGLSQPPSRDKGVWGGTGQRERMRIRAYDR